VIHYEEDEEDKVRCSFWESFPSPWRDSMFVHAVRNDSLNHGMIPCYACGGWEQFLLQWNDSMLNP